MSVSAAPSIFDVFNARQYSPQQVASTFVPPEHFSNLAKSTHTLIVGPRGSGKTTLLKMLHPSALDAWDHPDADAYRESIDYVGVFIATDVNWNEQIKALGDGQLDEDTHRLFAKAAFTTAILKSLCGTMQYQSRSRDKLLGEQVENVAGLIKDAWFLPNATRSLESISEALDLRLSNIEVLASQEATFGHHGRPSRLAAIEFLHLDYLTAAGAVVRAYDRSCRRDSRKWALLFDELELAPSWIRRALVRNLRSVDERFLFKMSLSPYSSDLRRDISTVQGPSPGDDYERIRLWYVNKQDGYPFSRALLRQILESHNFTDRDAESVFGVSPFDTPRNEYDGKTTAYRSGSKLANRIASLAEIDESFAKYLRDHNTDATKLEKLHPDKRAAVVRQFRSVMELRLYFKGEGRSLFRQRTQQRRSRNVPKVYAGANAIFAMVEGNPRWLRGICSELIPKLRSTRIKPSLQVRAVRDAAEVFRALLGTIPCSIKRNREPQTLLELLDIIGKHFADVAINGPFRAEPPSSFTIDDSVSETELSALGDALNAGAIVYAPDTGDPETLETLRGSRFRLSYIFAPYYYTPLVLGPTVHLNYIRKVASGGRRKQPGKAPLFDSEDSDG